MHTSNTNPILNHLAHTTLLPSEMSASIKSGNPPTLENIVEQLVIGAMDVEAVVNGDPTSTWNEKRIARLGLVVAFLAAIMAVRPADA